MADTSAAAEHLALVLTDAGMQRMSARVWGAVLCADQESVTAGELAEQLGVSAGAVSGAVRTLLTGGLIVRVPSPGSRRDHYAFPQNAWVRMMTHRDSYLLGMRSAAVEGITAAGEDSVAGRRLAEMRDFFDYLHREMPVLLERWERERQTAAG